MAEWRGRKGKFREFEKRMRQSKGNWPMKSHGETELKGKWAEKGGEAGEVSDREKPNVSWESFGAEVHCGRAKRVLGGGRGEGSEVWINASDWRRSAAAAREQNTRDGWSNRKEA